MSAPASGTTITAAPTGTWVVDPSHSRIGFAVKHLGIATVRGGFGEYEGRLQLSEDPSASKAYGTVKVDSIDTSEPARDEHLRSPDFFAAESHPEITFEATGIEQVAEDRFRITGNLTLHGVTREITLEAQVSGPQEDVNGNDRIGVEVSGELSRSEFGMKFNAAMGSGNLVVSDRVKLELDISAVKRADVSAVEQP